jgi:predicted nuclease with TOPRIM domain
MAALANGSRLANGEIKRYPAYAHRDALKTCRCRHRMNQLDERVISKLQEIAGDPKALIQSMNNSSSENPEDLKKELENISSERKKIMDRKNKLLDLYMDGEWSKEELEYKKKELDVTLSELGKREDDVNKKLIASITPDIDYERIALDCLVFKEFGKILSIGERIELLRKFVHEVKVKKNGEIEIYLYANDGKIICAKCM